MCDDKYSAPCPAGINCGTRMRMYIIRALSSIVQCMQWVAVPYILCGALPYIIITDTCRTYQWPAESVQLQDRQLRDRQLQEPLRKQKVYTTQWIPHLRSSPIFLDLGGQPWVYRAAVCLRCSNM